ncbi:uncharacterized protein BX663DRAFT_527896 [Cokeromyces recurvatus]|uniref:uncharacterized protein n=1 Tax=Cokeromyces recurvatus TaxID=90255 RepID=UPI00221EF235|nr:uncharacterized protein BX663DRAFT_527896 [Cokeromyces recurvatus]KAI7897584.1 hypothetical protein BX663DRAFT_527896 [Cokeromyces recurvatus]
MPAEYSKAFFIEYPAHQWAFQKYFELTHNGINNLKNYKLLLRHYLNDGGWISGLESVPSQIKDDVSSLKTEKMIII